MNPLLDKEFLAQLDEHREKEVYAKIIALTLDELPVEEITGRVSSGGSLNVDGTSAIRRSCSFSMIAKEMNINEFYWGLNTKFKLFMGLKNTINNNYPEIIWFPQGIFLISSFSISQSTNNFTISIQGKDKMSLLNGEIGGSITAKTDFGTIEEIDLDTNTTTITHLPIKDIIKEGVHEYAREPWENIIINDLDDYGVELMQYKGSKPLYLFVRKENNDVVNMTLNENMWVYCGEDFKNTIALKDVNLNKLNNLYPGSDKPTEVKFSESAEKIYTVARIDYGMTAGYRWTDITYAGDLIANAGEAFTVGVLDKIVQMLGDFEYFYDVDGRFIFQRKKTYINQSWTSLQNDEYAAPQSDVSEYSYYFDSGKLVSSFSNSPNLANLKNDFVIWGQRTTASGAQVPIHLRYALDYKPTTYASFGIEQEEADEYNKLFGPKTPLQPRKEKEYNTTEYDWRELIYQMALDYRKFNHWDKFLYKVKEANPETCPKGYTGYEQYYTDMEGFWRQLYKPTIADEDYYFKKIDFEEINNYSNGELYIKPLKRIVDKTDINPFDCVVIEQEDDKYYIETFTNKYCNPNVDKYKETLFYKETITEGEFIEVARDKKNKNLISYDLNNLYIKQEEKFVLWADSIFEDLDLTKELVFIYNDEYVIMNDVSDCSQLYINDGEYNKYYYTKKFRKDSLASYLDATPIEYYVLTKDYDDDGWHVNVSENPESLNFWFDFMDPMGELAKYAVPVVGSRPKVVNETTVKAIYYRETLNVVFINKNNIKGWELTDKKAGYTYIQIPESMLGLFTISAQGQSALDKLDTCLYNNTYCIESVSMNIIPIYYLQPNTKIYIRDDNSKINGEYNITRFTIPLTFNGSMSVSATKVADRLL